MTKAQLSARNKELIAENKKLSSEVENYDANLASTEEDLKQEKSYITKLKKKLKVVEEELGTVKPEPGVPVLTRIQYNTLKSNSAQAIRLQMAIVNYLSLSWWERTFMSRSKKVSLLK